MNCSLKNCIILAVLREKLTNVMSRHTKRRMGPSFFWYDTYFLDVTPAQAISRDTAHIVSDSNVPNQCPVMCGLCKSNTQKGNNYVPVPTTHLITEGDQNNGNENENNNEEVEGQNNENENGEENGNTNLENGEKESETGEAEGNRNANNNEGGNGPNKENEGIEENGSNNIENGGKEIEDGEEESNINNEEETNGGLKSGM